MFYRGTVDDRWDRHEGQEGQYAVDDGQCVSVHGFFVHNILLEKWTTYTMAPTVPSVNMGTSKKLNLLGRWKRTIQ
jgi:hypothetical protein